MVWAALLELCFVGAVLLAKNRQEVSTLVTPFKHLCNTLVAPL
jgi:hypothetical protein